MRTSFAVAAGLVAVASAGTTTITDTVDVTITSCEPSVTNCPYKGGAGGDNTWSDWSVSASTTKPVSPASTSSGSWDPTWSDWNDGSSKSTTKPVSPASTSSSSWDATWSDWSDGSSTSSKPVSPATTSSVYGNTWSDWASTTTGTPVSPASGSAACGSYTATAPPAWFSLLPTDSLSSLQAQWTGAPPSDWCYYTYSASSLITATPVAASTTAYGSGAWSSAPVAAASTGIWSYSGSATPVKPAVATYTGAANVNTGSFALAGLAAAAALVMA